MMLALRKENSGILDVREGEVVVDKGGGNIELVYSSYSKK